jgi:outer membrane lipoprotein SlyB
MTPVVGVFQSRSASGEGIERLLAAGIKREHISVLTPASSDEQISAVPVSDTEQPGMGEAVGTLVGGALGTAGGFGAGAALASFLLPGVGPILAGSLIGAGLLGLGGAAAGAAAGEALEEAIPGVPRDEMYVYEDALRQGRTVIIAQPEDEQNVAAAHRALAAAGAETIDAARENWWIGLRSAEEEHYTGQGGDFDGDEQDYRRGFEAAQSPALRGKSWADALDYLASHNELSARQPAFRQGFERGQRYRQNLRN